MKNFKHFFYAFALSTLAMNNIKADDYVYTTVSDTGPYMTGYTGPYSTGYKRKHTQEDVNLGLTGVSSDETAYPANIMYSQPYQPTGSTFQYHGSDQPQDITVKYDGSTGIRSGIRYNNIMNDRQTIRPTSYAEVSSTEEDAISD